MDEEKLPGPLKDNMTWAYEVAKGLIEKHFGQEDKAAFIHDLAKILIETRLNSVFEGATIGEHKVWGILWDILLSRAVADKSWQTFMAEQCRKFLSELDAAPTVKT